MREQLPWEKEGLYARASTQTDVERATVRGAGIDWRRTRVGRVVVELALLHSLEAKRVPAQRRVRHELRLELAVGERHLPAAEALRAQAGAAIGCISRNRRIARMLFSARGTGCEHEHV